MIGRLTGTLIEKLPPTICLDVNGVGYDIDVPMSTLYDLPELGAKVTLYTHLAVREDAHTLFGFLHAAERSTFRALIKVSGIGSRTALSLLSGMSVSDLAASIANQDATLLLKVPGIGKKTAERLLLELRGKLGDTHSTQINSVNHSQTDILNALIALGYSERESQAALKTLPIEITVSDGIRMALKSLAK